LSQSPYVENDIGHFLWQEGAKPLKIWENWLKKYNMILLEDYPFKKIYADDKKYKVVIVLYADPKEHRGKEMTISNENASVLFQLLNLPEVGNINPIAFLKRIEYAKKQNLSEFARSQTDEQHDDPTAPLGLGKGPRMISFGLPESKLRDYFMHLEELCDHCVQYECNVSWA